MTTRPALVPVAESPCKRVPRLFQIARPGGKRLSREEKRAAIWLCRTRCPRLEECRLQPREPGYIQAGEIITRSGKRHSDPTTPDEDRERICSVCGDSLTGTTQRTMCTKTECQVVGRRNRQRKGAPSSVTAPVFEEQVRAGLAGVTPWADLSKPARVEIVRWLHAKRCSDPMIAERMGITTRMVRWIRKEHLQVHGWRNGMADPTALAKSC